MANWSFCLTLVLTGLTSILAQWGNYMATCVDTHDYIHCYTMYITGMCYGQGQSRMIYECRRTCSLCHVPLPTKAPPPEMCGDKRTKCASWKQYCKTGNKWFKYMQKNCPSTCGMCKKCEDATPSCRSYKRRGFCESSNKFFNYMKKNCPRSCLMCGHKDKPTEHVTSTKTVSNTPREKEFTCNFREHECDWVNLWASDTADWMVGVDRNGPKMGLDGINDSYLFLDSRSSHYKAELQLPWQMVLPMDKMNYGQACFSVHYQMDGAKLTVKQVANPTAQEKTPRPSTLLSRSNSITSWSEMKINVNANEKMYLLIEGTKQIDGYIGLDNFYFQKGPCT